MVTVKELLALPVLRKLKVIAGHSGLNKRVSFLTVMEVPDMIRLPKGHDFVITSLYAMKGDVDKQIDLIDVLTCYSTSILSPILNYICFYYIMRLRKYPSYYTRVFYIPLCYYTFIY